MALHYRIAEHSKYFTVHESVIFSAHFGVMLKDYWDDDMPYLGFDVVKFGEWLHPRSDESTVDCIERRFGEDALRFFRSIATRVYTPRGKRLR